MAVPVSARITLYAFIVFVLSCFLSLVVYKLLAYFVALVYPCYLALLALLSILAFSVIFNVLALFVYAFFRSHHALFK